MKGLLYKEFLSAEKISQRAWIAAGSVFWYQRI